MPKESKHVHFSIEGDYITDISRQMMTEGNWRGALRVLGSIEGLPMEEQISILKGDKYFTGTNDLELVVDNREETKDFKESIIKQYGKFIAFKNKFYEPYATVDSWCREDLPKRDQTYSADSFAFTSQFDPEIYRVLEKNGDKSEHPYARSLHYADDTKHDFAVGIFNSTEMQKNKIKVKDFLGKVILFKEAENDVPFFLEDLVSKTPVECLAHQPWLEQRGATIDYYQYSEDEVSVADPETTLREPKLGMTDVKYPHYEDDEYDEKQAQYMKTLMESIKEYADNDKQYGWKTLVDEEGRTLKVPGRAFLHYALNHSLTQDTEVSTFEVRQQLPEYKAISTSGLKMLSDNPYHTDCWLGAGMDIDTAYDHDAWQYQLFLHSAFDFQRKYLNYDFHLLSRDGLSEFKGITCTPSNYEKVPEGQRILVLPHLGVEFEQVALKCDAIIAEQGGPMAHLVIVGKELKKGFPIMRVENACVKFLISLPIKIDLINGKIDAQDNTPTKKVKP